jgi:hypothetical protein
MCYAYSKGEIAKRYYRLFLKVELQNIKYYVILPDTDIYIICLICILIALLWENIIAIFC